MRLLADENFPRDAVQALREAGHDVVWVATNSPSISDREVLARAAADQRVLLTFDKDFGELVFRVGLPASCGVVLFRMVGKPLVERSRLAVVVLMSRADWAGRYSVVRGDRIRSVPLPPSGGGAR